MADRSPLVIVQGAPVLMQELPAADSLVLGLPLGVGSGGTGQANKDDAFKALAPTTSTDGDLVLYDASGTALWILASGAGAARRRDAFALIAPTTTLGDLVAYQDATNKNVRVPVSPTNGYRLSADSAAAPGLSYLDPMDGFYASPVSRLASASANTAETTNTSRFLFLGRAKRAILAVVLRFRVTTAAATITWAEVGIFKSTTPPNFGGGIGLSRVGYVDVSAVINSTGLKEVSVPVSGVNPGDYIWAAWGAQAATMPVFRAGMADDLQSGGFQTFAGRISTMSVPTTTALAGAALAPVWLFGKPS